MKIRIIKKLAKSKRISTTKQFKQLGQSALKSKSMLNHIKQGMIIKIINNEKL